MDQQTPNPTPLEEEAIGPTEEESTPAPASTTETTASEETPASPVTRPRRRMRPTATARPFVTKTEENKSTEPTSVEDGITPPSLVCLAATALLLTVSCFSLSLFLLLLGYGEWQQPNLALGGISVVGILTVGAYLLLDYIFGKRKAPKSIFTLLFFASFLLFAAVAFLLSATVDLTYYIDHDATLSRRVFLAACTRLVIPHATVLLFRLALEIRDHARSLSR